MHNGIKNTSQFQFERSDNNSNEKHGGGDKNGKQQKTE